jgi:hypothetical protein
MAYVLPNRKLFFVHIPKNAGNSIARNMIHHEDEDHEGMGIEGDLKHEKQEYFLQQYPDYTFFCVVRNPYSRLVSAFHYYKRGGGINDIARRKRELGLNTADQTGSISIKKHTFSEFVQGDWILGWGCVEEPSSAYFSASVAMHALPFEDLQNSYTKFCEEQLDLSPVAALETHNRSNHDDWRSYYDDDLASIVYEKHREDFDRFSYDRNSYRL